MKRPGPLGAITPKERKKQTEVPNLDSVLIGGPFTDFLLSLAVRN